MRQPLPSAPSLPALVQRQRDFFLSHATRPLSWRQEKLAALEKAIRANEARFFAALKADLGKSDVEAWMTELGLVLAEVRHARRHLSRWARPRKVATPLPLQPATSWVYPEPLGVGLIIGPWNYPAQLVLSPLVGALAAGCTAIIKPSEHAPATAQLLEEVLGSVYDAAHVAVVQGDAAVSQELLAQKWDAIFFTGSPQVGRTVAEAAARQLTPAVLELGGKSPAIVAADADVAEAARRIAWGKTVNAGQTCVAPDYVLVDRRVKDALLEALPRAFAAKYGPEPKDSPDFGRIVNERHFRRLTALLEGGRVVCGGQTDAASRYIAPTVLDEVRLDSPLMQEEIFGPLLPIVPVENLPEAIAFVRARPRPLALYVFTRAEATARQVLEETSSGGAVVNDTLWHVGSPHLPFGGVGHSGTGRYHGRASFEAFTHEKSVVKRPSRLNFNLHYPPYAGKLSLFKRLLG